MPQILGLRVLRQVRPGMTGRARPCRGISQRILVEDHAEESWRRSTQAGNGCGMAFVAGIPRRLRNMHGGID